MKLYPRIFLSVWLVLGVSLALVLGLVYLLDSKGRSQSESLVAQMDDFSDEVQRRLWNMNQSDFQRWFRGAIDGLSVAPVFLLNSDGGDIYGRELLLPVAADVQSIFAERLEYASAPLLNREGDVYSLVAVGSAWRALLALPATPEAVLLLVLLVVTALVSVPLTRYLVLPISRMNRAGLELGRGDLSVRVGQIQGHRRDELAELANTFDAMAEYLEKGHNHRREVVRAVAHELRSPVTRVLASIDLFRRRNDPKGCLDLIEAEMAELSQLIAQALDTVRLEGTAARLEPFDLSRVVDTVCREAQIEAQVAGVSVRLFGSQSRQVVLGDETRLRMAVSNVIRNAIRYAPAGTTVTVSVRDVVDLVEVVVEEEGPGVPCQELEGIFMPFVRAGNAEGVGSGLGLAIARQAVTEAEGRIWAANIVSGGFRVVVELPLLDPHGQTVVPLKIA